MALFRSLVTSLLEHERIETTEAKAKEIRILADRMITLGKEGSLYARRRVAAYIRTKSVVSKLFKDIAGRFSERKGGYTRLIKTRRRVGDAAPMVVIELVSRPADKKDITKGRPADQKDAGGSLTKAESPQPKTPTAAHA
jgi:large subunit ribosomal protein L17